MGERLAVLTVDRPVDNGSVSPDERNVRPIAVDTHAHVSMGAFDEDRDQVIARARERGISFIELGFDVECRQESPLLWLNPLIPGALLASFHIMRGLQRFGRRLGGDRGLLVSDRALP
jgi:hypothetical protein